MSEFQFFMPIAKVDKQEDGTCIVSGYASTPTKDGDGEIVTLDAIKKALPGYMEWGNIREMHQLKAVGKAQEANLDSIGLFLRAKVTDPTAVKKCIDEVYQGFSIGGRKLSKTGNKITEIEMTEISVVDRPANPDCRMTLAKSAKTVGEAEGYLLKAKSKVSPERKALAKMAKVVGDLAKATPILDDEFQLPGKIEKRNPNPKDDSDQNNKGDDTAKLCKAHGVENCTKCSVVKVEDKKEEEKEPVVVKKTKEEKRLIKAKLAAAFGLHSNFLTLNKAKEDKEPEVNDPFVLKKSMRTVGSMSYSFDSLREAQRSLLMEAKREGGDMKDKALAKRLGDIAKQLAEVISQKASHEGSEATDLSDADDGYLTEMLGEDFGMYKTNGGDATSGDPIADAIGVLMKRAAVPTRFARMEMAKADVEKSRKAAKAARKEIEDVHKMLKTSYIAKASKAKDKDKDDDEFDHAEAMGKLQKAFGEINKARDMAKAAGEQIAKAAGRSGQRGQEVGDAESGFYEVPPGVTDLTPAAMAGAAPGTKSGGSQPPMYPVDGGRYPGKAASGGDLRKYITNGQIPAAVAELLMEKAQANGELEALRRMPAAPSGGRRPYAFDMTKVVGGTSPSNSNEGLNKALFNGIDPADFQSENEHVRNAATAKAAGNFILSGQFGKSVFDGEFKGAAGSAR